MKALRWGLVFWGIFAGAIFYQFVIRDNLHEVSGGQIYRSAQMSGDALQQIISKKQLKTIINLRGRQEGTQWYDLEKKIAAENGVQYYSFGFSAHRLPDIRHLDALVEALETAPRPLLLHCMGGADRSGMAGALALSIEENAPLSDIRRQYSLLYGVLPHTDSIGTLFFPRYERWLNQTNSEHSWDRLAFWIRNVYVDNNGNLKYAIDWASGIEFKPMGVDNQRGIYLPATSDSIPIVGWACDSRTYRPVSNLSVVLSDKVSGSADFRITRPDVADFFGLDSALHPEFMVGWVAEIDGSMLRAGCHEILLRVDIDKDEQILINTGRNLCIEE